MINLMADCFNDGIVLTILRLKIKQDNFFRISVVYRLKTWLASDN